MRRLRALFALQNVSLVIFFSAVVGSEQPDVQPSCLDHFFHGQRESGIRKLGSSQVQSEGADAVMCEMPQSIDHDSTVTTIIHNGLEDPLGHKITERSTVGYQIHSLELLRNITRTASSCKQTVNITLPATYSSNIQPASLESVLGMKYVIGLEEQGIDRTIDFVGMDAGVLHLFPAEGDFDKDPAQPVIHAGPLICEEKVSMTTECLFNMTEQSTLTLVDLQQVDSVSFAFRTDQPNTPLFTLNGVDGSMIKIEIAQGYLIKLTYLSQGDEELRETKLLSDGFWHTIDLDLRSSSLIIDQLTTSIMLDSARAAQPTKIDFSQFLGQIARIKYSNDKNFKCTNAVEINVANADTPLTICEKNSKNFCNCKGPSAAVEDKCDDLDLLSKDQMFQLRREATKPAFFFIDNYQPEQALSVLFKSDEDSGLVFFTVTGVVPFLRHMQVFYIGSKMTAVVCENRANERPNANCHICEIDVHQGFSSYSWYRISFFTSGGYHYLTVDEQICQLRMAPFESHYFYAKSTHKIQTHNALFVGGYPSIGNQLKTFSEPFDDYDDNTREKVGSIQGCIGDLFVGGKRISLMQAYEDLSKIIINNESPSDKFSIDKGCSHCEQSDCNGAFCHPVYHSEAKADFACDCSSTLLYNFTTAAGETCRKVDDAYEHESISLSASHSSTFEMFITGKPNCNSPGGTGCYLDKLWVIFRPPTSSEMPEKILKLDSIEIATSAKGKKVHISVHETTLDFLLDVSDERSHFVIFSRNAAVGTREHYYTTRIQVDNQYKDIPYMNIKSINKIEVKQLQESTSKKDNGGCISDIGVSYKGPSDDSIRHSHDGLIVNVMAQILQNPVARSQLQLTKECGIRDNNIWMSSISPAGFGAVGSYNPLGTNGGGGDTHFNDDGGLAWWIIVIIIVLLLLAIIMIVIIICFLLAHRKKRDYNRERAEKTYKKAAELKPLRTYKDKDPKKKIELAGRKCFKADDEKIDNRWDEISETPSPYSKPWVPVPHPDRRHDSIKRKSSNLEDGFGVGYADTTQNAEIVRRNSGRGPPIIRAHQLPLAQIDEIQHIDV